MKRYLLLVIIIAMPFAYATASDEDQDLGEIALRKATQVQKQVNKLSETVKTLQQETHESARTIDRLNSQASQQNPNESVIAKQHEELAKRVDELEKLISKPKDCFVCEVRRSLDRSVYKLEKKISQVVVKTAMTRALAFQDLIEQCDRIAHPVDNKVTFKLVHAENENIDATLDKSCSFI